MAIFSTIQELLKAASLKGVGIVEMMSACLVVRALSLGFGVGMVWDFAAVVALVVLAGVFGFTLVLGLGLGMLVEEEGFSLLGAIV